MDDQPSTSAGPVTALTALNADLGVTVTPEGIARARARRRAVEASWTPDRWAALRDRVRREVAAMTPDASGRPGSSAA